MSINFLSRTCSEKIHCEYSSPACLEILEYPRFGINDGISRMPAFVLINEELDWDLTVENPNRRQVQFKAIDFCVDIFRTGSYNLNNNGRATHEFSSDEVSSSRFDQIKRCEGMLIIDNEQILFIEIKKALYGGWLKDAREKFEESILSFKEHHPGLQNGILKPIIANRVFKRTHQNEMVQKKILKEKIGVDFLVQSTFEID